MATTKRRYQAIKDEAVQPAALKDSTDLISDCVKVLAQAHPRGLTSKELSSELGANKRALSSAVLASKLNALFRRYHGDSGQPTAQQLVDLPLLRQPSEESPKRLVYLYAKAEEPVTPPAEADEPRKRRKRNLDSESEPAEAVVDEPEVKEDEPSEVPDSEPPLEAAGDAPEETDGELSEPSLSGSPTPSPSLSSQSAPSPVVDVASVDLAADAAAGAGASDSPDEGSDPFGLGLPGLGFWAADTSEYVPPEALALDELDAFVC